MMSGRPSSTLNWVKMEIRLLVQNQGAVSGPQIEVRKVIPSAESVCTNSETKFEEIEALSAISTVYRLKEDAKMN